MITDEIVYTEARVWKLDYARSEMGPKKTAIWAKAIGRGGICVLWTHVKFPILFSGISQ